MSIMIDCAPMEGLTGAAFRRCHSAFFPGVDRYYAPFVSPGADRRFTPRELRELLPENNRGFVLVPQILTKNSDDFLWCAGELKAMGYDCVNLNAGCPSGTVTAKGKGAGILADIGALDRFLYEIFEKAPCRISVKTRLGIRDPEEFGAIMETYNKYPIDELIIHPRVRDDFYRENVRREHFEKACNSASMPLTYNGGIENPGDFAETTERWPGIRAVMLGQGLIADPFLASKLKGIGCGHPGIIREFHDALFEECARDFQSRNNAVQRMNELWSYLGKSFPGREKQLKKIKKARTAEDYLSAAGEILSYCEEQP